MLLISQKQALQRWDTLPDNLREALCAEENSDFIWKTCEGEHIPDEKIYAVARITGYVLMGFLHPDDAAKEIEGATGIDTRTAATVADAIKTRIFNPLRQSIDSVSMSADTLKPEPKTADGSGPMMIEEIPMTMMPTAATAASQKPAPAPKFPIKNLNAEMPVAASSAVPTPASAATSAAMPKIAPQFLDGNPQIQASLPLSKIPEKKPEAAAPKPVIIQEAAAFETNKKSAEFHIETSEDRFQGLSNIPRPMPQKAAVLEFSSSSKMPGSVPVSSSRNSQFSQNLNGKTEMQASIPPRPTTGKYEGEFNELSSWPTPAPEKGRTVTEITSSFQPSSKNPLPSQNLEGQTDGKGKDSGRSFGENSITPAAPASVASKISAPSKISAGNAEVKNFGGIPPVPQYPRIQEKDLMGEFAVPAQIPTDKPADKTVPAPAPFMINAIPAPVPQPPLSIPPLPIFGKNILPSKDSDFSQNFGGQVGGQTKKSVSDAMQFTAEKPARGIVPPPSFTTPTPVLRPSFFSKIFKKEPAKPTTVIQKNYSEADIAPKIPSPSQTAPKNMGTQTVSTNPTNQKQTPPPAPLSDLPIPPKKI